MKVVNLTGFTVFVFVLPDNGGWPPKRVGEVKRILSLFTRTPYVGGGEVDM